MDGTKLSLSALKDKVSSKLSAKPSKKENKKKRDTNLKESGKNGKSDNRQQKGKDRNEKKHKSKPDGHKKDLHEGAGNSETDSMENILKREALALGASEEDLELLRGVDDEQSETEFGESQVDESLNNDLSKFMKTLGFPNEVPTVNDDALKDEEAEEEEEEDDLIEKSVEEKDAVVDSKEESESQVRK